MNDFRLLFLKCIPIIKGIMQIFPSHFLIFLQKYVISMILSNSVTGHREFLQ